MIALAVVLTVASIFSFAFLVIFSGDDRRRRVSTVIANVMTPSVHRELAGRRTEKKQNKKRRSATDRPVTARPFRPEDEVLPWPFSGLDALQRQAGEYEGPLRILLTIALSAAGLGLVAWLLTGQALLVAGAAFCGFLAPAFLLRRKAARRMNVIEDQVSGVCLRLAQAVEAGAPLETAFREVAQTTAAPFGEELRAAVREAGVGARGIEAALANLPKRVPGAPSVRMLVASIQISMEMGADIGPQLERIADMLRQRRISTARVSGTVAMARMQGKALSFAPLLAYIWLRLESPQTLAMFNGPAGQIKLLAMAAWTVLGYFVGQMFLKNAFGEVF